MCHWSQCFRIHHRQTQDTKVSPYPEASLKQRQCQKHLILAEGNLILISVTLWVAMSKVSSAAYQEMLEQFMFPYTDTLCEGADFCSISWIRKTPRKNTNTWFRDQSIIA